MAIFFASIQHFAGKNKQTFNRLLLTMQLLSVREIAKVFLMCYDIFEIAIMPPPHHHLCMRRTAIKCFALCAPVTHYTQCAWKSLPIGCKAESELTIFSRLKFQGICMPVKYLLIFIKHKPNRHNDTQRLISSEICVLTFMFIGNHNLFNLFGVCVCISCICCNVWYFDLSLHGKSFCRNEFSMSKMIFEDFMNVSVLSFWICISC